MLNNLLRTFSNVGNNVRLLKLNFQYNRTESQRKRLEGSIWAVAHSTYAQDFETKRRIENARRTLDELKDKTHNIDKKRDEIYQQKTLNVALNNISRI